MDDQLTAQSPIPNSGLFKLGVFRVKHSKRNTSYATDISASSCGATSMQQQHAASRPTATMARGGRSSSQRGGI